RVLGGAGAAVLARAGVVRVHAALHGVARIVRAGVLVIAVRGGVRAARPRIARIVRAGITVAAVRRRTSDARPLRARVVRRAGAAVVARAGVVRVRANTLDARVVRAHVAVVAVHRLAAAPAGRARIGGAGIGVVAGRAVRAEGGVEVSAGMVE